MARPHHYSRQPNKPKQNNNRRQNLHTILHFKLLALNAVHKLTFTGAAKLGGRNINRPKNCRTKTR